ncbi:MAG: hypothetical protein ACREV4_10400 [Gammaproteobacteria bacterium]
MSIESVPGTDLAYYLIAFDEQGRERTDDPGGLMSRRLTQVLATDPVTDVFLISHGWKGDLPAAKDQYTRWIACMAQCGDDIAQFRELRPGFRVLLVGLHWPSLPWGDEEFGSMAVSFAVPAAFPLEELVDKYARRLASSPAARTALATIFEAAQQDTAPEHLPPQVRDAYLVLDREASLGNAGVGGAPGADREPFDPERVYQDALDESPSFGEIDLGGLLSPLRQLSFWKMKDRARCFGEFSGHKLLGDLQRASVDRHVRFHLMGHSFGCIVVSAALAGPNGEGTLVRPVDSVALVQGALSHWSYCSDIPVAHGRRGYFHSLVSGHKVAGPIITTQSQFDTAVGRFYPLGAGARQQVSFVPGEYPKYGALGTFGARGPGVDPVDLTMQSASVAYRFEPGRIYNLEGSHVIREGGGASGAHSDIVHPEVAHAMWEAARVS